MQGRRCLRSRLIVSGIRHRIGRALARYLSQPADRARNAPTCSPAQLAASIRKGDVLLVDGNSRFSTAIRYLTQSTWSHATLYVGDGRLLEADVIAGVHTVPLATYARHHTRICRPVGLDADEIDRVVEAAHAHLGNQYDMRNLLDLTRYLLGTPPIPNRYKRRVLALGSGDPTRAICSTLIAEAYQSVLYPILPEAGEAPGDDPDSEHSRLELLHIRNHRLFAPRDFDVSPYFRIVKPTLDAGFDPHALHWAREAVGATGGATTPVD